MSTEPIQRGKPIYFDFSTSEDSRNSEGDSEYLYAIRRSMEQGEIHPYVIESERWITEGTNPQGDKVIAYIRGLMDKLSETTMGTYKAPDLQIVLCDQPGINTGVITTAETPILIVGLGMIDIIKQLGHGEDHLVAILGHERFHLRCHKKWKDLKNGRTQETLGDVYGVLEAERAGYNPQALGNFFKAIKHGEKLLQNWGQAIRDLVAVHPKIDDRIRNTELAIAALQLEKRMTDEQTDIPADILEAVENLRFETHFDKYAARTGYAEASPAKKVKLLGHYLSTNLDPKDAYLGHLYVEEARPAVKELNKIEGGQKEAFRWFRYFMEGRHKENPRVKNRYYWGRREGDELYPQVLRWFIDMMKPPVKPGEDPDDWRVEADRIKDNDIIPPVFQRLKTDSEAFWNAKTRQEAVAAAKRYHAAKASLGKYSPGIEALNYTAERKGTPSRSEIQRDIRDEGAYRFPWEAHLKWACGEGETPDTDAEDSALIDKTMRELGANDPRMPDYNKKSWHSSERYDADDLTFADDGSVTAIAPTKEEIARARREKREARFKGKTAAELFEREYDLQQKREAEETELLQQTDWSAMEDDFWGFVQTHAKHLTPTVTVVPGKYPFANAFMERLEQLRESDPETWEPIYVTFLTGYPDKERYLPKPEGSWDQHGPSIKVQSHSFPELLGAFKETYALHWHKEYSGLRGELPEGHPMEELLATFQDRRRPETIVDYDNDTGEKTTSKRYPRSVPAKKEPIEVPFKIDVSHPYARAIANLDTKAIGPLNKSYLVKNFRYANPMAEDIDRYFNISSRHILSYSTPFTPKDLRKVENKARSEHSLDDVWLEALPIEILRIFRKLDKMKPAMRYPVSELGRFEIVHGFGDFENKKVRKALQRELKTLVEKQIRRNRRIDFSVKTPVHTLIERYLEDRGAQSDDAYHTKHLNGQKSKRDRYHSPRTHNIFVTRPKLDKAYQEKIRERIEALPAEERYDHLTQILKLQLRDPEYREWAMSAWVESSTLMLGKDDGSEEYANKTLEFIRTSIRHIDAAQGMNCIVQLLDSIEAQRKVALGARDKLVDTFGKRFLEQDGSMRVIDSAVDTCAHNPELREAFLKYITEPLSFEGSQAFAKLLKEKALADHYSDYEFVKRFFDPRRAVEMSAEQENMTLDYLHQNIWAMPFELRTIYLDRILFPTGEDTDKIMDEAIAFVLDKVLPLDKKLAAEAREALLVYLDCCPPELRRTTFSAILATTEHSSQQGELRPGQVLSDVLRRTGAAGGQLLQAGHSYLSGLDLSDPDVIQFREDLKDSKVNFDSPYRWEIFERMDEALPEDYREGIDHVGSLLGSGSTAYVVALARGDKKTALKLMRKNVISIADLQFERFFEAFTRLAQKHEHYKPLPSMVDHARDLIQVSARGDVGADQVNYAQESYDHIQITVDGETFSFKVAPVVDYGLEYLETDLVEGDHLNDLKTDDEASRQRKKKHSIAIETLETYLSFRGRAIDQDRHGGQQKIIDLLTGIFDVGALPYDLKAGRVSEPNESEKRALGRLLGLTLNAAMEGKSPIEAFVHAVTTKEWGEEKAYLVGIKRALLARMDVHAGFSETALRNGNAHKELTAEQIEKIHQEKTAIQMAIFRSVWHSKQIDPEIFRGLTDTVSLNTCQNLAVFAVSREAPAHNIVIHDSAAETQNLGLSLSSMTKIIAQSFVRRTFNSASLNEKVAPAADPAHKASVTPAMTHDLHEEEKEAPAVEIPPSLPSSGSQNILSAEFV